MPGLIDRLAAGIRDGTWRTWGLEDRFSFHCTLCGRCCVNNEIMLDSYDILNLRRAVGLTTGGLVERQLVELGWSASPGNVICRLRFHAVEEGTAVCPFLKSLPEARDGRTVERPVGCAVHAARPAACRAYPLGRVFYYGPDDELKEQHIVMVPDVCEEGLAGGRDFAIEQRVGDWIAESGLGPYWQAGERTPLPTKRLVGAGVVRDPGRRPPQLRWMDEKAIWRCYMPIYLVDELPWVARQFPANRQPGEERHAEDLAIVDRLREVTDELATSLRDGTLEDDEDLRGYLREAFR